MQILHIGPFSLQGTTPLQNHKVKIDVEIYVQTVEVSIGLWTKFAKNSVENVQNVKAFTCFLIIFHISIPKRR